MEELRPGGEAGGEAGGAEHWPGPANDPARSARLGVSLTPVDAQVMVGQPAHVEFVVENITAEALSLGVSWMGRNRLGRPDNYAVEIRDVETNQKLAIEGLEMQFGGQSWAVGLAPGGTFRQLLLVTDWARFPRPGRYELRVTTTLDVGDPGAGPPTFDDPSTQVEVVAVGMIEVVPDDPEAIQAALDQAAAIWAEGGEEADAAGVVLSRWRDDGAIEHLIAGLEREHHRATSIVALGSRDDGRAVAALVSVGKLRGADLDPNRYTTDELRESSADSIRHMVAAALAENAHPRAWSALSAMRGDSYDAVRLTVLHAAASRQGADPEAAAMVLGLRGDASTMVASEAKRYAKEQ